MQQLSINTTQHVYISEAACLCLFTARLGAEVISSDSIAAAEMGGKPEPPKNQRMMSIHTLTADH